MRETEKFLHASIGVDVDIIEMRELGIDDIESIAGGDILNSMISKALANREMAIWNSLWHYAENYPK